jgi:hypothetical protein
MPYNRSALSHLSAIMPVKAGINKEAKARVENIAPNCGNVHCLALRQYVPMVISQAPHTKNCKKLMRVSLNFMLIAIIVLFYKTGR